MLRCVAGSLGAELRTVPGVGHSWEGHEATLAFAIGEWLWRRAQQALEPPGLAEAQRPSGHNIFVDSLTKQVQEIHAEVRCASLALTLSEGDAS